MAKERSPRFRVRLATAEDADEVADVLLQSRHASVPEIPSLVHPDHEVRGWIAGILMNECEVWVVEAGGAIAAMMALRAGWIEQLYVAPSYMSQGIGGRLIEKAKERQPDGLELWTFEANIRAQRFYERHGFEAVRRTDGSDNEEGAPDVLYRWRARPRTPPGASATDG